MVTGLELNSVKCGRIKIGYTTEDNGCTSQNPSVISSSAIKGGPMGTSQISDWLLTGCLVQVQWRQK